MKKKIIMTALMLVMALSAVACGKTEVADKVPESESQKDIEDNEVKEEVPTAAPEEEEMELPNWKGCPKNAGTMVYDTEEGQSERTYLGSYSITIHYPSVSPNSGTSGFHHQRDHAAVRVSTGGYDENGDCYKIENIEDTFYLHMDDVIYHFKKTDPKSSDIVFDVEKQEVSTINNMPVCFYEGQLTYMHDKDGPYEEERQRPFAAYSFYTGQIEGYSYFTVVVLDDTQSYSFMDAEPLPEGTIQAYARKMVESVIIK